MPRKVSDAKIALINTALEISKTETDKKLTSKILNKSNHF